MTWMRISSPAAKRHLHWLDWLKVLVVLGVFYYHSSMVFAYAPWMLSNRDRSLLLSIWAGFAFLIGMPLLFLVAGADAWFGLRSRTPGRFLRERFRRLVIPLAAGLVLLSPAQAYLFALSRAKFSGSLVDYYPYFFTHVQLFWNPRWFGAYGYHLWFLAFLFLYSALALPLLLWLRGETGGVWTARLAWLVEKPGGMLLFAIPVALAQMALRARFPRYQDWSDFTFLLVYFVIGFVLLSHPRYEKAVLAQGGLALGTAIVGALAFIPLGFSGNLASFEAHPTYSAGYLAYQVLRSVHAWAWVLVCLNIGMRFFDFGNRFLDYASEAILPFYVLHHPVIVVVAYFVIQWDANLWVKHFFITFVALAITVAAYDVLIRRHNWVRSLFGLKPRKIPVPAASRRRSHHWPLDRVLVLSDGRRLAFTERGDPQGTPVFHCHGLPGSRVERQAGDAYYRSRGIRLVTADRPGYGLSDWQPERTLMDWPRDVAQLMTSLGIDRFGVTGISGGGPFALAIAYALPERLLGVAVASGLGPLDSPAAWKGLSWTYRAGMLLATSAPQILRGPYGLVANVLWHNPTLLLDWLVLGKPQPDRLLLARKDVRKVAVQILREAVRNGAWGAVDDVAICARPWGFSLAAIRAPVRLWQGDADTTVPLHHGLELARRIPGSRLTICPGEGHTLMWMHLDEIFDAAAGRTLPWPVAAVS